MKHVIVDLKHCYGIKELKWDFDFSNKSVFAIYAPNGVMKSSLAQTFLDASKQEDSRDRIFKNHKTTRNIVDERGDQIEGRRVLVVVPYDEDLGPTEQTSVLLSEQGIAGRIREAVSRNQRDQSRAYVGLATARQFKGGFRTRDRIYVYQR